jgi:tetratricopeptide (TPR) repeat protein
VKWIVIVVAFAATPVWAQSKRYPPQPADKDLEREQHSNLWTEALTPNSKSYEDLVRQAKQLLDGHAKDQIPTAIALLDQAAKLMPNEPDAYVMRGEAYLAVKPADWTRCADDLAKADAKLPSAVAERAVLRRELGVCQARANRLAEAEHTLQRAVSTGPANAELWLRLGEVRIAMGKLDEAVVALNASLDLNDGGWTAMAHWLLAVAYDRKRQPSDADDEIGKALNFDHELHLIEFPSYPLLGAGEAEYVKGLAWRTGRPEWALMYFRRFLQLAPDSPWRRRAEEHYRDLAATDFPLAIMRETGSALLDLDAARGAAKKVMPAMRACMKALPYAVFQVVVTKTGARSVSHDRLGLGMPPAGVNIYQSMFFEGSASDREAAQRCLEAAADKLAMPTPKDHDTWYKASFYVVSP